MSIVAGWAWDDRILMVEQVSRSAQADMAILLAALGLIGLLFAALALVGDWLDRRALDRQVDAAHLRVRPFDRERDKAQA